MGKVNDFIKTNIKDYVPISRSINSHDNNVKEIKEFMNANNASWSNFIKKRKDIQLYRIWLTVKFI